jgi:hypothetical protein
MNAPQHAPETPAARVTRLFGGPDNLAKALGISRVQIWRWDQPVRKGGAGGTVPSRHHQKLLEMAAERKIGLTAHDLMPWLEGAA